jgi:membrane-bound lytic murein transglycosylase B
MKVKTRLLSIASLALALAACTAGRSVARPSPAAATKPAATTAPAAATTTPAAATTAPAAATPPSPTLPPPTPFDLSRQDIDGWIKEVSARHGIPAGEVRALLADGRSQPRIIAAMTRPAEKVLAWWQYSERLVSETRITQGVQFWREHRSRLEAISARTGVDTAYLVAIVGIETSYGRGAGTWRVLDALMTLGFDYPPRADFFRSELEQFVLLAREEKLDPRSTLGSYAGAMGAPQFIPSSYRRLAVDGSGDGRRDLFTDWDDVLASVANYFVASGWQRDGRVLAEATAPAEVIAGLDRRNLDLNATAGALRARGVQFDPAVPAEERVLLIPAEGRDGPGVRIGFANFRVITRYNRSILYAMAVHDIAEAVRARITAEQR